MRGMSGVRAMLAAAAAALALLTSPTTAAAEPAVWTIRDTDSTILLFGSVHLLPDGLVWRPAALEVGPQPSRRRAHLGHPRAPAHHLR